MSSEVAGRIEIEDREGDLAVTPCGLVGLAAGRALLLRSGVSLIILMPIGHPAAAVAARRRKAARIREKVMAAKKARAKANASEAATIILQSLTHTPEDFLARLEAAEGRDEQRLTSRATSSINSAATTPAWRSPKRSVPCGQGQGPMHESTSTST